MSRRAALVACVTGLLLLGAVLRVWSFEWNDRVQGDIGLFALAAREFADSGQMEYPIKYEFSDRADYCSPRSVVSQHPPLFPWAAGLLARVTPGDDTFFWLKILSELGAILLLGWLALRALRAPGAGTLVPLGLVVLSPALVDFSANGSPYVWSGLLLLLAASLIGRVPRGRIGDYVLAGALSGLGPQLHPALYAVPAGFLLAGAAQWRRVPLVAFGAFLAAGASVAAPWLLWNWKHFGTPLYSYNPHVLWTNLGLAREGIYGDVVSWRWADVGWVGPVATAARTVVESAVEMVQGLWLDAGPGGLLLAVAGALALMRVEGPRFIYRLLPLSLYLALVLPFLYRDRFVVPLLPVFYQAAGIGFAMLAVRSRALASLLVALVVAWMSAGYFESPPTRYYRDDAPHRAAYTAMLPVARDFALLPPGTTLGASGTLDGGIAAAYYHRNLLVRGRSHGPPLESEPGDVLRKLRRDFGVRYVWADQFTVEQLEDVFPDARRVLDNGAFVVLKLPGGQVGVCGREALMR